MPASLHCAEVLEPRRFLSIFTVTNLNDGGPGSFRQAAANAGAGANDVISFQAGLSGAINLTSGTVVISGKLAITGPGASLLTIQRAPGAANFGILDYSGSSLNLSGLTISGGLTDLPGGGLAIHTTPTNVTLDGMVFSSNSSVAGGAIFKEDIGFLTVRNSTITGNTATFEGGGILSSGGGSLLVENSTISNNISKYNLPSGGGISFHGTVSANPPPGFIPGIILIKNSTISGNSSLGGGGGFYLSTNDGTLEIQNSTWTGNSAASSGGAVFMGGDGAGLTIKNSTIFGNSAGGTTSTTGGGGIAFPTNLAGPITIQNSIVSGNTGGSAPDIRTFVPVTVNARFSAFGPPVGFSLASGSSSNLPFATNLLLHPLRNDGGPTQTMHPQPASPLINAGSNALIPAGLITDQRGGDFVRTFNATVDIGAVEYQPKLTASATVQNITTGGETSYTFTVTYADNHDIDVASIIGNNSALRVTDRSSFDVPATFVSIDDPTNGTLRTATYSFTPPGGSWDPIDNRTYFLIMQPNQVHDVDGSFTPDGQIASFAVNIAFIVTNLNDSGPGSLRQTILDANSTTFFDTIRFQTGLTGTINLTSGRMAITSPLNLIGPGASQIILHRDPSAPKASILGTSSVTLNLSGLTITGGATQFGVGAGLSISGPANLDGMVFTDNVADRAGGAIYVDQLGSLTLRNSIITNNSSTAEGGGGGIYVVGNATGTTLIDRSTISGNVANFSGGGIFMGGGDFTVQNSTISNNTSLTGSGGGVYALGGPVSRFYNSTITGNSAALSGGGIYSSGSLVLRNSTVTTNSANATTTGAGAGGIFANPGATFNVFNSIVSGNTNVNYPDIRNSGQSTVNFSAIGSPTGFTLSPTSGNNLPYGANLLLGPLQNNGGPTLTRAPQPGSPLINSGSNAQIPPAFTTDQRGSGFARISGSSADIGAVEIDAVLPAVQSSHFNYTTGPQSLSYIFSEPVTLDSTSLELHNVTTSTIIPTDKISVIFDATTNTATFTFPGYPFGILPDGDYRGFLLRSRVSDPSQNQPATDHVTIFHFLKGDLNDDRRVSIFDFMKLGSNFNKSNATYLEGDLNYDGIVSIADFIDLSVNFNVSLGTPPTSAIPQSAAAQEIQLNFHRHRARRLHHHRNPIHERSNPASSCSLLPLWRSSAPGFLSRFHVHPR